MPEHALAPAWPKQPRSLPDMRRLAKRVVDGMPKVRAAILFGSRARKTARRDSDWDVALLAPERYKHEVLRTAPRIPTVSYVSLSPKRLRERHNRLGTLERSVARDGVLLAGEWTMPKSQTNPTVSYENLASGLQVAADQLAMAIDHLGRIIRRYPDFILNPSNYGDNTLAGSSQYASEHLAKAALLHLEIDHPESHKVLKLAGALRSQHPGHPWIKIIESFNGQSHDLHVAEYEGEIVENLDRSLARLYNAIDFYGEVLAAIAKKRPDFTERLQTLCGSIADIVFIYQNGLYWETCPDELKQRLLQWNRIATYYSQTDTGSSQSGGD